MKKFPRGLSVALEEKHRLEYLGMSCLTNTSAFPTTGISLADKCLSATMQFLLIIAISLAMAGTFDLIYGQELDRNQRSAVHSTDQAG